MKYLLILIPLFFLFTGCEAKTEEVPAPRPPRLEGYAPSPFELVFLWQNPAAEGALGWGLAGYRIYQGDVLLDTSTRNFVAYGGLSPGELYCVSVSAVNRSGEETIRSPEVCVRTPYVGERPQMETERKVAENGKYLGPLPAPPGGLKARPVSRSAVELSWEPSRGPVSVGSYRIYRNGEPHARVIRVGYLDRGLRPGGTYCYQVSALDLGEHESDLTSEVCASTHR